MGAEQSQEQTKDGEKPDASHQNLALQAAEKARAFAQGSSVRPSRRQAGAAGNAEQVVQRQAPSGRAGMQMNSAGRVPQQAAPQQGQDLAAQSKWAKLFEQAKEDEAREAAGEVVHPGIGPGGRTGPVFDVSQQQRQALERRNAAMAASAGRGAGEKTYGVKFWEKSGNKYEVGGSILRANSPRERWRGCEPVPRDALHAAGRENSSTDSTTDRVSSRMPTGGRARGRGCRATCTAGAHFAMGTAISTRASSRYCTVYWGARRRVG
jgi:hypothetical protein